MDISAATTVLRLLGKTIRGIVVRSTDLAARYGGEEFVILLPETGSQGALLVAEKIRTSVCGLNIPHDHSSVAKYVTASLGTATSRCTPGGSVTNIVAQADQQLYAAKNTGRNRVCGVATV